MTYLVYGIVKDPAVVGISLTGMKGQRVSFVAGHGLCAAVSEMAAAGGAPPISELLVYSRVVEDLHRLQAVVPMRYGCFLVGVEAIRNALEERRRQYETLLTQLEGHVEMGIRIHLPEKKWRPDALSPAGIAAQPKVEQPVDGRAGRAYLAHRKVLYQMQDETLQSRQALIDRYIGTFSGLYTRQRAESDKKNDTIILSLYFLTPDSTVSHFRETFRDMMEKENAEAMLSGPWPPYNFVTPDLAAAK